MANITIQSLEVESTALNQVSPGEMEKVIGGFIIDANSNLNLVANKLIRVGLVGFFAQRLTNFTFDNTI